MSSSCGDKEAKKNLKQERKIGRERETERASWREKECLEVMM